MFFCFFPRRGFLKNTLLGLCFISYFLGPVAKANPLEILVQPTTERSINNLNFFFDRSGILQLAYSNNYFDDNGDTAILTYLNNTWSSPIISDISLPNENWHELLDVQTMSNGFPMMLLIGDNTDYREVLQLPETVSTPPTPEELEALGYDNAFLSNLFESSQRLFFSLHSNNSWFPPIPIPGTFRASNPQLTIGGDNSALLLFERDLDENDETLFDSELYWALYQAGQWSDPIRLTNNNTLEEDVQPLFLNGQYIVVWGSDQDNQPDTFDDKRLYYTTITASGHSQPTPIDTASATNAFFPLLSRQQNQAVLLWSSDTEGTGSVWESRFDNSWMPPQPTELPIISSSNRQSFEVGNYLYILLTQADKVETLFYDTEQWHILEPIINFRDYNVAVEELHFIQDSQSQLHLGIAGFLSNASSEATDETDDEGNGIFYTKRSLLSDLSIASIEKEVDQQNTIGETTSVTIIITNQGILPSSAYELRVTEQNNLVQTLQGETLAPGTTQTFQVDVSVEKASTNITAQIQLPVNDANSENNVKHHTLHVLPDFKLTSLTKYNATTLIASVSEQKGIATPPALVKIFRLSGDERIPLGEMVFNSNNREPLHFSWPEMAEQTDSFQVYAVINESQEVEEDDYYNNTASYYYEPQVDLMISYFKVTPKNLLLTIQNQGNTDLTQTDLMFTEDPLQALNPAEDLAFHYMPEVLLNDNEVKLVIPRQGIPPLEELTLYAVVNPYGFVSENNRNNNAMRSFVPLEDSGNGEEVAHLKLENITTWCGAIQTQIVNDGSVMVLGTKVQLLSSNEKKLLEKMLPVVGVDQSEGVKFSNVLPGTYHLRLDYSALNESFTETRQVVLDALTPNCLQSDKRDLALLGLEIVPEQKPSKKRKFSKKHRHLKKQILDLEFSIIGFNTDYKTPLIRVPILIDVKKDGILKYHNEIVLFIPETGSEQTYRQHISLPAETLSSGDQLIIQTPMRDDESKGSNNKLSINIE